MFFLVQGALLVVREGADDTSTVVGEIFPGESFGETAVLPGQTRGATVRAARASVVGRLPQHALLEIIERHPAVLRRFLEVMVERQQVDPQDSRGRRCARTITLVPLGPDVPLRAVSDRLLETLTRFGKAVWICRETVVDRFGAARLADAAEERTPLAFRLEYWFEVLRAEHDVVVLEGDHLDSAWTRRCVDGASEIVLVGVAGSDPTLHDSERALFGPTSVSLRTTLVLLLPQNGRPSHTARWFVGRRCVEGLEACLDRGEASTRGDILGALLDIAVLERTSGGYGVGERAAELVLTRSTVDERLAIAAAAASVLQRAVLRVCCRQRLGTFVVQLGGGAEAERAALLQEKGDQRRRIARLLALHEPKEAAQVLAELDEPGELTRCAELFIKHGYPDQGHRVVEAAAAMRQIADGVAAKRPRDAARLYAEIADAHVTDDHEIAVDLVFRGYQLLAAAGHPILGTRHLADFCRRHAGRDELITRIERHSAAPRMQPGE